MNETEMVLIYDEIALYAREGRSKCALFRIVEKAFAA